jgi:hypothetical protein
MIKRAIALAGFVSLIAAGVATAGGSLPASGSGTIQLASVDGASMKLAPATPHYEGTVTFDSSGTSRLKNARVYVRCYQFGSLVYGEAGGASSTFTLGGGWSLWVAGGGGSANCWADLYYFKKAGSNSEWNGNGQQEYVWLATTPEWDAVG